MPTHTKCNDEALAILRAKKRADLERFVALNRMDADGSVSPAIIAAAHHMRGLQIHHVVQRLMDQRFTSAEIAESFDDIETAIGRLQ